MSRGTRTYEGRRWVGLGTREGIAHRGFDNRDPSVPRIRSGPTEVTVCPVRARGA